MRKDANTESNQGQAAMKPGVSIVLIVLCLIGLGVAIELTRIHYFTHTDSAYRSICAVNDLINCESVAQSPFSVFMGVPVSILGIFGYTLMGLLAVWSLTKKRLHPTWPFGALFWIIVFACASSAILAYISFTRIDSLCIFCMTLYITNILLLVTGIVALVRVKANPFSLLVMDIKSFIAKPLAPLCLVVVAGGSLASLVAFFPPYWQHPGWADLKDLPTGEDEHGCHWIGAEDPLVTIIEFSDYECPHCRRAHKKMRLMAAEYPEEVRLIHNHLPLDQACNESVKEPFHNRACEFSKAAECAGAQDKFWKMNDALFSVQNTVRTKDVDVERLAIKLGLDRSTFNECMEKKGIPDCILTDIEKAASLNVKGTPTFIMRSKPYPGEIPEGALEAAVQQEREKKAK
ncbi:MAG: thioredoxin domain-containing protein [Deltaproteobacteria bacterium]|nr:thioredoxin domain-containing protein [Deltaproteobacteria bacterium]